MTELPNLITYDFYLNRQITENNISLITLLHRPTSNLRYIHEYQSTNSGERNQNGPFIEGKSTSLDRAPRKNQTQAFGA